MRRGRKEKNGGGEMRGKKMWRGFTSPRASPLDGQRIFEREQADEGRGWGRNFPPPPPYACVQERRQEEE